ncbi:hypothetical protein AX774_g5614 [Zancudomyces culisetae]|uniref:Uncharacterized protein n=1 Tax=Zancudomyces culisetae TaxID=1213189 RepID=A0A1R1PJ36_ZANCU|nr:hypothetical protein AX774_g5614 [Zancudomyces culisetae]|eukprot:OMH80939.1 hypothetical protein AX774_g5614 [Zancudomyces culisetae]
MKFDPKTLIYIALFFITTVCTTQFSGRNDEIYDKNLTILKERAVKDDKIRNIPGDNNAQKPKSFNIYKKLKNKAKSQNVESNINLESRIVTTRRTVTQAPQAPQSVSNRGLFGFFQPIFQTIYSTWVTERVVSSTIHVTALCPRPTTITKPLYVTRENTVYVTSANGKTSGATNLVTSTIKTTIFTTTTVSTC